MYLCTNLDTNLDCFLSDSDTLLYTPITCLYRILFDVRSPCLMVQCSSSESQPRCMLHILSFSPNGLSPVIQTFPSSNLKGNMFGQWTLHPTRTLSSRKRVRLSNVLYMYVQRDVSRLFLLFNLRYPYTYGIHNDASVGEPKTQNCLICSTSRSQAISASLSLSFAAPMTTTV